MKQGRPLKSVVGSQMKEMLQPFAVRGVEAGMSSDAVTKSLQDGTCVGSVGPAFWGQLRGSA